MEKSKITRSQGEKDMLLWLKWKGLSKNDDLLANNYKFLRKMTSCGHKHRKV